MPDKRPLLIHSNAPWSTTGYGIQTGLFAPKLAEHYDLGISSFYGLEGAKLNWDGITVYPGITGDWGNGSLPCHARDHFKGDPTAGLILTLMDVWVLNPEMVRGLNCACWVPVDHEPAPPPVLQFFEHSGAIPIAMSKFGAKMLSAFDPLYVPHGIDTKTYRPRPKDESKAALGLEGDPFVVGMVAANKGNPSRKCFAEAFLAFRALLDQHPDCLLYLHTEMSGRFEGVDLFNLLQTIGVPPDKVRTANPDRLLFSPYSHGEMAQVYSALDVLLAPSAGEGFGIPVLEANACGVPAIVTDFSAQPEVCGAGWTVKHHPYWTGQGSWQVHPDVGDTFEALRKAYASKGREDLANQARQHAGKYDVDRVVSKHFLPALEQAWERLTDQPVELRPEMAA